jgi:hypothetical protein
MDKLFFAMQSMELPALVKVNNKEKNVFCSTKCHKNVSYYENQGH